MPTALCWIAPRLTDDLLCDAYPTYYLDIDEGQTIGQVLTEAQALTSLLDPIVGPQVTFLTVQLGVALLGTWKGAATADVHNGNVGLLSCANAVDGHKWQVPIPGLLPSKVINDHINTGDAGVAAFIAHLLATGTSYTYSNKGGYALTSVAHTFLGVRQYSRKGHPRT